MTGRQLFLDKIKHMKIDWHVVEFVSIQQVCIESPGVGTLYVTPQTQRTYKSPFMLQEAYNLVGSLVTGGWKGRRGSS